MTAPADIGAETPVLEVKSLTVELPKGTDRQFAVEEISFAVRPREIVCLVGESGSGKSVSAFSVMGLLPQGQLTPVGGEILLQGENVLTADAERLRALRCTRMSMIFQEPMTALNPVLTCGDQIDEVLRTHTDLAPEARRGKIIDIMNDVQLPDPAGIYGAYSHQLSGGQRQRIMIAMALVLDPVLLIADEPTTALDVTTQAQILHLIKALQARHDTGVLFITHDFGVVAEIADRVAVMRQGEVVEYGPVGAIFGAPQHPYTIALFEAAPGKDWEFAPLVEAQLRLPRRGDRSTGDSGVSSWHERRGAPLPGWRAGPDATKGSWRDSVTLRPQNGLERNRSRRGRNGSRAVVFGDGADDDVLRLCVHRPGRAVRRLSGALAAPLGRYGWL